MARRARVPDSPTETSAGGVQGSPAAEPQASTQADAARTSSPSGRSRTGGRVRQAAAQSRARWAIDLEPGGRSRPASGAPGTKPRGGAEELRGSEGTDRDCSGRGGRAYSSAPFAKEEETMTVQSLYLGREQSIPGLTWKASGKVRDIYEVDAEHLLFVTTDRVSAFDVIMNEGIPYKGEVLTTIAAWWFEQTGDIIENHLVSTNVDDLTQVPAEWRDRLRGRIMLVRRAQPTTVEWVIRNYLAGSGWKEYQQTRSVCGVPLPEGLQLVSRLPEPIFTPTTKDDDHDEPITAEQARERVGAEVYDTAYKASFDLFERGTQVLAKIGVILADTKFEFGTIDGKVVLIDEALTPDSSRFWPAEEWQPGKNPPSYDKQILRNWLETLDWNKQYPPPTVDPAVLENTSARYLEICEKLTGKALAGGDR